jgi:diguanylate cyclase (GGDEF)-like protein
MIDLDGYKQLNDRHGHQLGDQILVAAGRVISTNMRKMDVAARYGGDEFILVLPHASAAEAAGVANRIRDESRQAGAAVLERAVRREPVPATTMSIGIAALRTTARPCRPGPSSSSPGPTPPCTGRRRTGETGITLHEQQRPATAA